VKTTSTQPPTILSLHILGRGMFASSVRRVAFTAPQTPIASPLSTQTTRAAASSYRSHQRRFSSSKPSSPADGSKRVGNGEAVPTTHTQAQPDSEKKASRTSKRKAKDVAASCTVKGRDEAMQNLPSVPSTNHIAANREYFTHNSCFGTI